MKTLSLISRIGCFVCVALMLALIIVQFLPNWNYEAKVKLEDGTSEMVPTDVSLAEITWFPTEHKTLTKEWNKQMKADFKENPALTNGLEEFKMNGLVPMPILSMVAAGFGIFLCLLKSKAWGSAILPIISGASLAYAAMTHPILRVSANAQTFQLLGWITVAVGVVALLTGIVAWVMDLVFAKKAAKR